MNTINRIELAIRRAASQMKPDDARLFKLVVDELKLVVHDDTFATDDVLKQYRDRP